MIQLVHMPTNYLLLITIILTQWRPILLSSDSSFSRATFRFPFIHGCMTNQIPTCGVFPTTPILFNLTNICNTIQSIISVHTTNRTYSARHTNDWLHHHASLLNSSIKQVNCVGGMAEIEPTPSKSNDWTHLLPCQLGQGCGCNILTGQHECW